METAQASSLDTSETTAADRRVERSLRAWLVVAAGAVVSGVGLGLTGSHGVFLGSGAGAADMGLLLVALSTGLQFGLSPLVGVMTDRVGVRRVVVAGAGALAGGGLVAGHVPVSAGAVAYAIGTGVAGACALTPLLATVSGWFEQRRTLAIGILLAGSGTGALVLPPALTSLMAVQDLATVWRAAAVGGAALMLVAVLALAQAPDAGRPHGERAHGGSSSEPWSAVARAVLRERCLRRIYLSATVATAGGAFLPTTFLVPLARDRGLSAGDAAALLGLVALVTLGTRMFLPALLAARWSAYRVFVGVHLALAATYLLWAGATVSTSLLVGFVVAFGAGIGVWTTLLPAVVAEVFPARLGTVLGMVYTSPAVGGPVGAVAGGVLWRWSGDAAWLALVGSATLVLAAAILPASSSQSRRAKSETPASPRWLRPRSIASSNAGPRVLRADASAASSRSASAP